MSNYNRNSNEELREQLIFLFGFVSGVAMIFISISIL